MTAAYVRSRYGIDYKTGDRVVVDGRPGVIVSFPDQYLGVRFDGERRTSRCHPTWQVERIGVRRDLHPDRPKGTTMTDNTHTATMTHDEVHAILDQARFGDTLTVVRTNGGDLTSTVTGPVLGDQSRSPAVGIDMFNGEPYIVREYSGDIWGQFLRVTLERGEPR